MDKLPRRKAHEFPPRAASLDRVGRSSIAFRLGRFLGVVKSKTTPRQIRFLVAGALIVATGVIVSVVILSVIPANHEVGGPSALPRVSQSRAPSSIPAESEQSLVAHTPNLDRSMIIKDGDIVTLRVENDHDVPLATTEKDYDRLGVFAAAHDNVGIAQMLADGRAWGVPSGTKCRVIDRGAPHK